MICSKKIWERCMGTHPIGMRAS